MQINSHWAHQTTKDEKDLEERYHSFEKEQGSEQIRASSNTQFADRHSRAESKEPVVERALEDHGRGEVEAKPRNDDKSTAISEADLMDALDKEMRLLNSPSKAPTNTQSEQGQPVTELHCQPSNHDRLRC